MGRECGTAKGDNILTVSLTWNLRTLVSSPATEGPALSVLWECVCVCTVTVHSELQVTSGIFEGTADFPRFPGVGFSKIPHVTLFFFLMDSPYWGGPG